MLPDETKYNIKLLWFNVLQGLYRFPPVQRIILVFGLLALLPGYWAVRLAANTYYSWTYNKQVPAAHASFANPIPLEFSAVRFFPLLSGQYIAYAEVENKNLDLAVFSATYTVAVTNASGQQMYATTAKTFLLPGEKQYVITPAFTSPEAPTAGSVTVSDVHFQKRLAIPEVRLLTPAVSYRDAVNGLEIEGSVVNQSPFTLGKVRLTFLLYDRQNNVVGLIQREESTLRPNTRRTFPQIWPGNVTARDISRIEAVASTNVLDAGNLGIEQ